MRVWESACCDSVGCAAGQALVQVVEDTRTHTQFAVKFYLSLEAFEHEKALYLEPKQPLGRFLPQLHAIVEPEMAFLDAHGHLLPPCIIMEKGEALDLWSKSTGEGMDTVTGLQVLHRHLPPGALLHRAVLQPRGWQVSNLSRARRQQAGQGLRST
jgi:hypothetical protein